MPYILLISGCIGLCISSIGLMIPYLQQLDSSSVVWMSLHRSDFINRITVVLSYLGGLPSTVFIGGIGCLYFLYFKKHTYILFIFFSIFGSAAIGWLLKFLINRPRPDILYQMVETYGASFPSAHSLYAATLACLLMFIFSKHPKAKLIVFFTCLWWLSMGVSRVYLGAHYPTDVLAGWSIGFIWVAILWRVFSQSVLSKNKLFLDKI